MPEGGRVAVNSIVAAPFSPTSSWAIDRHHMELLLRMRVLVESRQPRSKDVEFSGTGPGLAVHLGQSHKAHIAAGFGREAHVFSVVLAASVPADTAVPQVVPSVLT